MRRWYLASAHHGDSTPCRPGEASVRVAIYTFRRRDTKRERTIYHFPDEPRRTHLDWSSPDGNDHLLDVIAVIDAFEALTGKDYKRGFLL